MRAVTDRALLQRERKQAGPLFAGHRRSPSRLGSAGPTELASGTRIAARPRASSPPPPPAVMIVRLFAVTKPLVLD